MKSISKLSMVVLALSVVLAACGGGGGGGAAATSGTQNLKVFVTSVTGNGNLSTWADAGGHTGLAAGDTICQARANAAGLGGTFKAWLSDSTDDAYCRMHNMTGKRSANCGQATLPTFAGPWARMDGFPFAATIDRMLDDDVVYAPVRFDELGNLITNGFYFTNTDHTGIFHTAYAACNDWTNGTSGTVSQGNTDHTTDNWTYITARSCTLATRLLCMQSGAGPSLQAFASTGKVAFITTTLGNGDLSTWSGAGTNTGLAAGDAICRARASNAGLANAANFKAWLSSSTSNAVTRITTNGPWVRVDGVRIANSKTDLIDGQLFAPINVSQAGHYLGNYAVWTGTDDIGIGSANHCSNWTSNSNTFSGVRGLAANAGSGWSSNGSTTCDSTWMRLYCLED